MQNIKELALELHLAYIKENHQIIIDEATHTKMEYGKFLAMLLEKEIENRKANSVKHRLKVAKFPYMRYLEDFDRNKYDMSFRKKFDELDTLEFIKNKEKIILVGTPGAGKTHYAIALGIKACMLGKNVMFASVPNLIIGIKEAMSLSSFNAYKRKFEKFDLVILDELGYVSFDKEGSEILFNLLSNRNDKGSIIITTNLNFERWIEVFKDKVLTGVIVDRLAHKAHILDISREESHRFEETIAWLKSKE